MATDFIKVRVTTYDTELEYTVKRKTTGQALFDQVRKPKKLMNKIFKNKNNEMKCRQNTCIRTESNYIGKSKFRMKGKGHVKKQDAVL